MSQTNIIPSLYHIRQIYHHYTITQTNTILWWYSTTSDKYYTITIPYQTNIPSLYHIPNKFHTDHHYTVPYHRQISHHRYTISHTNIIHYSISQKMSYHHYTMSETNTILTITISYHRQISYWPSQYHITGKYHTDHHNNISQTNILPVNA